MLIVFGGGVSAAFEVENAPGLPNRRRYPKVGSAGCRAGFSACPLAAGLVQDHLGVSAYG
ncbi:MAG TPA: hypothetical protein VGB91_10820 [Rhizomicrobium sp.]